MENPKLNPIRNRNMKKTGYLSHSLRENVMEKKGNTIENQKCCCVHDIYESKRKKQRLI